MDNKNYNIHGLEEYIRQSAPARNERGVAWRVATQKEMAKEIGKSERTVKNITVALQDKGVLRRVGGKRDGRWEIIEE